MADDASWSLKGTIHKVVAVGSNSGGGKVATRGDLGCDKSEVSPCVPGCPANLSGGCHTIVEDAGTDANDTEHASTEIEHAIGAY